MTRYVANSDMTAGERGGSRGVTKLDGKTKVLHIVMFRVSSVVLFNVCVAFPHPVSYVNGSVL